MTRLHDLYDQQGQSIWLDSLTRSCFDGGHLAGLIESGVRGLTSNPTLMANAIRDDSAYDPEIRRLAGLGVSAEDMYWELVNSDVERAAELFVPLYEEFHGDDGFVSVEVSPDLAHDAGATTAAAADLRSRFGAPNIMIKIPATVAGLTAIEDTIAAGISVNVTLIFSVARALAVLEAYTRGVERLAASGGDPSSVRSVASFFISRVDTEVDGRLAPLIAAGDTGAAGLLGHAAVAQAQLAFSAYADADAGQLGDRRRAVGAAPQRLLWASTSAKNPAYDRLLYVNPLVGPGTVNTMPEVTIRDVEESGVVARSVDADLGGARSVVDGLAARGIAMAEVAELLEERGVAAFVQSFADVQDQLRGKRDEVA